MLLGQGFDSDWGKREGGGDEAYIWDRVKYIAAEKNAGPIVMQTSCNQLFSL